MTKGLAVILLAAASATYVGFSTKSKPHPVVQPITIVAPSIVTVPAKPIQGDPVLVVFNNLGTSTVGSITFNKKKLALFAGDKGRPAALIGIDLRMTPGTYPIIATLSNGTTVKKNVIVGKKVIATAPLGIPESLGGNTTSSVQTLKTSLADEATIINNIPSSEEQLWHGLFAWPLSGPIVVTDPYGYQRQTVGTSIAHKGTDFRAATGTPVLAINDGKVAYTGFLRNYGNVVAVDHGSYLLSLYLHLSQINVSVGQSVKKGDVIALSGATGYVLGPHLHLTIRIGGISIDPMKFMQLMGVQ